MCLRVKRVLSHWLGITIGMTCVMGRMDREKGHGGDDFRKRACLDLNMSTCGQIEFRTDQVQLTGIADPTCEAAQAKPNSVCSASKKKKRSAKPLFFWFQLSQNSVRRYEALRRDAKSHQNTLSMSISVTQKTWWVQYCS